MEGTVEKNGQKYPTTRGTVEPFVKGENGILYPKDTYNLIKKNTNDLNNWQTNVNKNPVNTIQQFGTYNSDKGGSYRRSTKIRKSNKRRKSSKRRKGTKRRK